MNRLSFKYSLLVFLSLASIQCVSPQNIKSVRPWLGIGIEEGEKGVRVTSTFPNTPAAQAGLLAGDEVLKVDGKKVHLPAELIQEVGKKGVGYTIEIEVDRKGKNLIKKITLVIMPDMLDLTKKKLLGKPVPDFKANFVKEEKKIFHMRDQIGKVTLLEFWATWCTACLASHPRLLKFSQEFKGKIDVVSLSGEEMPILKKYLKKLDVVFKNDDNPIVYIQSPEGEVSKEFLASAIPMFVLIDKKGIVSDIDLGGGSVLENMLLKAQKLQN